MDMNSINQSIKVFAHLGPTADPGDDFEVTVWVPDTFLNPILTCFNYKWQFRWSMTNEGAQIAFNYSTSICMLLTPSKSELHSWNREGAQNWHKIGR